MIRCNDDYTGLWEIIRSVRRILGIYDPEEIKHIILKMVLEFLKLNFIIVGFPLKEGGFSKWEGAPTQLIKQIKENWETIGNDPDPGDVIWFNITKEGEAELKRLQAIKN